MSTLGKRKRNDLAEESPEATQSSPEAIVPPTPSPSTYTIDETWVTPSRLRNHLLRDPLIDWLKENNAPFVVRHPLYTKQMNKAINEPKSPNSFTEFIMEQGKIFEDRVMALLYKEFGADMIAEIGGELNPTSRDKVNETLAAMNKGVPIIHSGLLHNHVNKTYGIPDLLVRSDWVNTIVGMRHLDGDQKKISAPLLRDVHNPDKPPDFHYVVIDIKFSTLQLRADGIHLLNSGSIPAYKGQVWVYNEALGLLQGYKPRKAYLLGRKWKFTSKGETFAGSSCFDRLGEVDFEGVDSEYREKTLEAVEWIRAVRSPEARNWNVFTLPLCREELYPNMSNTNDYPWHKVKEMIAKDIAELTQLWMVGTKQREIAHGKGVYRWDDEKCTVDVLGFGGNVIRRVLAEILDINQHEAVLKLRPRYITNNLQGWQTKKPLEFYVDFETVNDVMSDMSETPRVISSSYIFMIGVGYEHPESKKWVYKCFTADSLTFDEERRICEEFGAYITSECEWFECPDPLMVHWANAEAWWWDEAIERHLPDSRNWVGATAPTGPAWFDLLKVFKSEPIVVKDAFGFSLKSIARAMHTHGMIKSIWDEGSSCLDGRGAMVSAWKCNRESKLRRVSMSSMPEMTEIQKYNEIDVKTMYEIISYLREEHVERSETETRSVETRSVVVERSETQERSEGCVERSETQVPTPQRSETQVPTPQRSETQVPTPQRSETQVPTALKPKPSEDDEVTI